LSKLDEGIL